MYLHHPMLWFLLHVFASEVVDGLPDQATHAGRV